MPHDTSMHRHEITDGGTGFVMGIVILITFLLLFFFYGLPLLRNTLQSPSIQIPEQINVDINQDQSPQGNEGGE